MKKPARYASALMLLVSLGCGCQSHAPPVGASSASWRAPGSTLDQNVAAANAHCPIGTTLAAARAALGPEGRLVLFHGGVKLKGSGVKGDLSWRQAADDDEMTFEYTVPGGKVVLYLAPPPAGCSVQDAQVKGIAAKRVLFTGPITNASPNKP